MSHLTTGQPSTPYNPQSDKRSRARAFFTRDLTVKDLGLLILATIVALGWTFRSPAKRIEAIELRMAAAEKEIGSLSEQQRFTNYMLCVNARRTDPASAPPDCAPIIESRKTK